jgi:pimeloyl-ACP methyl ester carboxylesterase
MPPETKYARSGDLHIAYQVSGQGDIDLVLAPGTVSHLDLDWEWPPKARFLERLGSFCRLIRFDKRGTGLSDRPLEMATLEQRTDDIRAVMDATESQQAAIFGVSEGGSMAALFAATDPERTRALLIWGTQPRWTSSEDYPWGQTPAEYERMIRELENWPSVEYMTGPGAGLGKDVDPAFLAWFIRYGRAAAGPAAAIAYEKMNALIDIRPILSAIRVPTLVMNRTGDPVAHVEAAREMATQIPGARFVEFPGDTHSMFAIQPERVLGEIEEFVTGSRGAAGGDRVLATVLFVDIVESTQIAVRLGDLAWRELLLSFYAVARREAERFRGREMDTAGDGIFLTFDGPARGIRCAMAIAEAAKPLGLVVRAGVHTGECELLEHKVGGIAVVVGARVMSKAGPAEVLVSRTVKDLVAGSGIKFEERGMHELKGVPGDWVLYAAGA